jgi:hypothetical protein
MEEWRYSASHINLDTRLEWAVNFTHQPHTPAGWDADLVCLLRRRSSWWFVKNRQGYICCSTVRRFGLKICAEHKIRTGMVYRFASVVTDIVPTVIWSYSVIQEFTKDIFSLLLDVFAPNTEKYGRYSWSQTFAVFWMLYAFFLVIPRRLNFICRRFGTLCMFHLHRRIGMNKD